MLATVTEAIAEDQQTHMERLRNVKAGEGQGATNGAAQAMQAVCEKLLDKIGAITKALNPGPVQDPSNCMVACLLIGMDLALAPLSRSGWDKDECRMLLHVVRVLNEGMQRQAEELDKERPK